MDSCVVFTGNSVFLLAQKTLSLLFADPAKPLQRPFGWSIITLASEVLSDDQPLAEVRFVRFPLHPCSNRVRQSSYTARNPGLGQGLAVFFR